MSELIPGGMPQGAQGQRPDTRVPLDAEQHFEGATSYQVRDELQELIARDLLGPWGGDLVGLC